MFLRERLEYKTNRNKGVKKKDMEQKQAMRGGKVKTTEQRIFAKRGVREEEG